GLLRQGHGRADRRSRGGLEGARAVVDLRHARALPRGRRQGDDEQGREVPAASRPSGALTTSSGAADEREAGRGGPRAGEPLEAELAASRNAPEAGASA